MRESIPFNKLLLALNVRKGSSVYCKGSVPVPYTHNLNFNPRQKQYNKDNDALRNAIQLGYHYLPVSLLFETSKLVRRGSSEGRSAGRGPEATFCLHSDLIILGVEKT